MRRLTFRKLLFVSRSSRAIVSGHRLGPSSRAIVSGHRLGPGKLIFNAEALRQPSKTRGANNSCFTAQTTSTDKVPEPLQGRGFFGRTWEVADFRSEGSDTLTGDPWRLLKVQGESGFLFRGLPSAGKKPHYWVLQPKPEIAEGGALSPEGQMLVTILEKDQMFAIYRSEEESDLPEPTGELHYRIDGPVDDPNKVEFSGEVLINGKPVSIQFTLIKPTMKREDFPLIQTPFRWIQEYADASRN